MKDRYTKCETPMHIAAVNGSTMSTTLVFLAKGELCVDAKFERRKPKLRRLRNLVPVFEKRVGLSM